jgi:1-acyl-sn-glycerol-3-phosphate acyltransferase
LIGKLGKYIEEHRRAACIFPEGTRAKDGQMRDFKNAGLLKLMKSAPSAIIVPVVISGSWELMKYKLRPIPFGVKLSCSVLSPRVQDQENPKALIEEIEKEIRQELARLSS